MLSTVRSFIKLFKVLHCNWVFLSSFIASWVRTSMTFGVATPLIGRLVVGGGVVCWLMVSPVRYREAGSSRGSVWYRYGGVACCKQVPFLQVPWQSACPNHLLRPYPLPCRGMFSPHNLALGPIHFFNDITDCYAITITTWGRYFQIR